MDFQGDLAASLVGHAEAVVEGREGGSGLGDETWTGSVAYEDAAIVTAMDAVAGLEHGAHEGQPGVAAHERPAGAGGAGGKRGEPDDGHLAGVLSAFADYYPILALGQAVMRIFSAITYPQAVD